MSGRYFVREQKNYILFEKQKEIKLRFKKGNYY